MRYELFICQRNRCSLKNVQAQRSESLRGWPNSSQARLGTFPKTPKSPNEKAKAPLREPCFPFCKTKKAAPLRQSRMLLRKRGKYTTRKKQRGRYTMNKKLRGKAHDDAHTWAKTTDMRPIQTDIPGPVTRHNTETGGQKNNGNQKKH